MPNPPLIDVVIPARNERDTIAGVVTAFIVNPAVNNVIVVCNRCDDDTGEVAELHGAFVMEYNEEAGKGQAVKRALDNVEAQRVLFCDADMKGPIAEYVGLLCADVEGMIIGVPDFPDRSPVPWPVPWEVFKMVSGIRCLPVRIPRSLDLHGYAMEVQINRAVVEAGLDIGQVRMHGVRGKIRKNSQRMAELRRDREWLNRNWNIK